MVGALTLLTASAAIAGSGVGGVFNLGKVNTVNAITKLTGIVPGASLVIHNDSTDSAASALNLQVEAGQPPMKVNSQTKVTNLNADKLDGVGSTGFYAAGSKVADADKLDGMDSTSFGRVLEAGSTTVDLPSIQGNSCDWAVVDPSGPNTDDISNDVVLVMPGPGLTSSFSVAAAHSSLSFPELFRIQVCNQTADAIDPLSTQVDWIVFDK